MLKLFLMHAPTKVQVCEFHEQGKENMKLIFPSKR